MIDALRGIVGADAVRTGPAAARWAVHGRVPTAVVAPCTTGEAAAVLIRALEPRWGIERMRERRGREDLNELCSGPGKLTEALGVGLELNRAPLTAPPFEIRARAGEWRSPEIVTGPRIGITRAAELPWRFCARGNPFVSRPRPPA